MSVLHRFRGLAHDYKELPMVRWYDPFQLVRTGKAVLVSKFLGRHADRRDVEALVEPQDVFSYPRHYDRRKDFWIDYVADAADGWDSAYAIARVLAQPRLSVATPESTPSTNVASEVDKGSRWYGTRRGQVLVLGGDQAYPVASRENYEARFVHPYETALRAAALPPDLFAIPGQHDWFDSLTAFRRRFCAGRWIGGWRTRQRRSYFALRLPHGWWLLGTDLQLGSDIDDHQVAYFTNVARRMNPTDRVILCVSEPYWIYAKLYGRKDREYTESNLRYLEEHVLGRRVAVYLAGDLHHYRRHATADARQKITAGGGGAFLHPTHGHEVSDVSSGYTLRKSYPEPQVTRRRSWWNLLFVIKNPLFGLVPGSLYLMISTAVRTVYASTEYTSFEDAAHQSLTNLVRDGTQLLWIALLIIGLVLFTDSHSKWYRRVAGLTHGVVHVLASFLLALGCGAALFRWGPTDPQSRSLLLMAGVFIAGWIVGSTILGIYLFISLNVFGRHYSEAFASLRIKDWKNFVRMRIDSEGGLVLFPIRINRVPRRWRMASTGVSRLEADDDRATEPELIERPICLASRSEADRIRLAELR